MPLRRARPNTISPPTDARLPDLLPPLAEDGDERPAAQTTSVVAPANGAGHPWLQEEVLTELQGPLALSSRPEARCAAALWLVSLLSFCRAAPALDDEGRLAALQGAFTALLGDANELTQDTAARGVSLVYARGGAALRERLLGQLVGALQGGAAPGAAPVSGVRGAALTGDTKLFEEGALGAAPGGGGLSTYRELAALATDLGQPELVYRFMDLARHAAAANAARGAAAGVAGIARLLGAGGIGGSGSSSSSGGAAGGGGGGALTALLGPERAAALLPRLFRAQHDPSPKVAEAMGAIWSALVGGDGRGALDAHFDAIARDVVREMGGRTWRGRQAACAALADLLQGGRRWPQLAPHLAEFWGMALRALDDVKPSVRAQALATARTLRGTSLRLMDASQTPPRDVAACCSALLPLMLERGLPSGVPEVRGLALDLITTAVRAAGPGPLAPLAPALVPGLLEALSGLEDARLNYLEQHAQRLGGDEAAGALEGARLAAARGSPLADALDLLARCVAADHAAGGGTAVAKLTPELTGLVRRGVGLATKAGAAHFVSALAQRGAFSAAPAAASGAIAAAAAAGEGADAATGAAAAPAQRSPVPQLLKALRSAVANERSAGVRKAYAAAAAAVAARGGEKRLSKFVADAVASYGALATAGDGDDDGGGGGSNAEEGSRLAGALLLRELMRASPDAFARHAADVLPVAFVGRMDDSADVAAAWGSVWEDGAPSEAAALRTHAAELAALLAGGLRSSSWGRKKACAEALTSMCGAAGDAVARHAPALATVLLPEATAGRLWDGKEALLAALGALASAAPEALAADPGLGRLAGALTAAAARRRAGYRRAALAALERLLAAAADAGERAGAPLPGSDALYAAVSAPLLEAVRAHVAAPPPQKAAPATATGAGNGNSAAAADADEDSGPPPPMPLDESLRCLAAAWRAAPPSVRAAGGAELFAALGAVMSRPGLPWASWLAAAIAADDVLKASAAEPASGAGAPVPIVWLPPLLRGLAFALAHSTVSQLRQRVLGAMARALDAAAASAGAGAPSLAAALDAAEAPAAAAAAQTSNGGGGAAGGAEGMDVDAAEPLSRALAAALRGVVDFEPSAALKAAAGALLPRLSG